MEKSIIIAALIVLGGIIALEIGFAVSVLEIAFGVLGGNLLGIAGLDWLDFLANFGLLALMFLAGFEIELTLVKENYRRISLVGVASFLTPFVIILLTSILAFGHSWKTAVLLATALSTTSLALVYTFLKQRHYVHKPIGKQVLASAMIVDLLSMLFLLVFVTELNVWTVIIPAILVGSFFITPRVGQRLFARYRGNLVEFEIKFVLFIILGFGFLASIINIHAAIFVFILGVLCSEIVREAELVEAKLRGIVFGFLAPIFFFKVGTLMTFESVTIFTVSLVCIFFALAVFGKTFGTYLAARLFYPKHARAIGILFNYRLSFGVIIATFGLELGIFTPEVFSALLITVLITAFLPSLLIKKKKKKREHAYLAS